MMKRTCNYNLKSMEKVYVHNLTIDSIIKGRLESMVVMCENLLTEGQKILLIPLNGDSLLNPLNVVVEILLIHSVSCSIADDYGHYIVKIKVVR